MPLYDFYCPQCNKTEEHICKPDERDQQLCACGTKMEYRITPSRYIPFHEGWYPNLGPDPVYVSSKRQLKNICEERNLGSVYLDDS